jgi:hypothetical protein
VLGAFSLFHAETPRRLSRADPAAPSWALIAHYRLRIR